MTETNHQRTTMIAVVIGIVTLLLGLCLGATIGGVGGYLIGKSAAPRAVSPRLQLPQNPLPATPPRGQRFATPTPQAPRMTVQAGAWIQEVVSGSPAAQAGLQPGDVITQVENTPIDANHRLAEVLTEYKSGAQVTLTVWRAAQTRTVKVTLGAHPDDAQRAYLGIRYTEPAASRPTPTD